VVTSAVVDPSDEIVNAPCRAGLAVRPHGHRLQFPPPGVYLGWPEVSEFGGTATLYFRVDDIDAEQTRLARTGVRFDGGPHVVHRDAGTELWMALFRDPDGNNLLLMEERAAG
jgi:catechol 2,3-dioxygenase-like lactoylglutathione lyase family enzyme